MASERHLFVFAYDIERDNARSAVAGMLESHLVRIQKSVFEGHMTVTAARRLAGRIAPRLGPEDSLRVYAITATGLEASLSFGPTPLPEEAGYYLF